MRKKNNIRVENEVRKEHVLTLHLSLNFNLYIWMPAGKLEVREDRIEMQLSMEARYHTY